MRKVLSIRLKEQIDQLEGYTRGATGLGGTHRRFPSSEDKRRHRIATAINRAKKWLSDRHGRTAPRLVRHLESIRTDSGFSYHPGPDVPPWEF
jgi:hypothetical protein